MDLGLGGQAYVLTGSSRGLGRATADVLVAEGARVVLSSRDKDRLDTAVAELGGPSRAVAMTADNGDPEAASRLVAMCVEAFGRIDGALISVGGPPPGTVMGTTEDQWRQAFDSVFLGAIRVARAVAEACDRDGSITFVLSTSVRAPLYGLAISNGLRPGLAMVGKTLADELGPRGIRVNGLMPGRIATDRTLELDAFQGDPAEVRARGEANIPMRRYGRPEEFGRVAAFIMSPAASYLTGTVIPVDGGATRAL
jgi:3-oxoacyl-[acyl-carrier protein] reductase